MSGGIVEFKQKEEVEEYLKNLLLEYKFSCLSEKNAIGCDLLGDYYSQITRDHQASTQVWKENCDVRAFPKSCVKYGERHLKGIEGFKRNREHALGYMEKACNQNDGRGCYYYGAILILGTKKRSPDPKKAMRAFEKSCDLNDAFGCLQAHHYYLHAQSGVKRDCEKSIKFGEIACDKLIPQACINLTRMYELGECAKVDIKKAVQFRQKYDQILQDMQSPGVNSTA